MAATSRAASRMELCMATDTMSGKMVASTKATIDSTRSMAKARIHTQTEASTAANGLTACNTALVASSAQKAPTKRKVFGPLASSNNGSTLIRMQLLSDTDSIR